MNDFIKFCAEADIDTETAKALLKMAGGDINRALVFIEECRNLTGMDRIQTSKSTKIYKKAKSEAKRGPHSDSSIYCNHANECPSYSCDCPADCYCRAHGNCEVI